MKETWVLWYRILLLVFTVFAGISAFTFIGVAFYILFNLFGYLFSVADTGWLVVVETLLSLVSGTASILQFLGGFQVLRHHLKAGIRFLWAGVILYAIYITATLFFALISAGYANIFASYTLEGYLLLFVSSLFSIVLPLVFIYTCGRRDLIDYRPPKK